MLLRFRAQVFMLLLLATMSDTATLAQRDASLVRVRLLERAAPQILIVGTADRGMRLYAGDLANPITTLGPGKRATLSVYERDVRVATHDQVFYARALRIAPIQQALLDVEVPEAYEDPAMARYAGRLLIQPEGTTLRIINHVPLEDYVASVVSHEYGFDDLEGSKAMAVLARTYALRAAGTANAPYDLSDHTGAQVYRGSANLIPASIEATLETAGEVLTYEGGLIEAVYFASSGGLTASNEDVWQSEPVPYLRSRPDPFDADAPHRSWETSIPRTQFLAILSDTYGSPVTGFLLHEIGDDGRVQTVRLLGAERIITGTAFRNLINQHFGATRLRSTQFDARREGDTYIFEGRGFGHGVGLSQWGAHAMAGQGYDYREILGHYYAGVMLQKGGRAFALPAPPANVVQTATRPPDPLRQDPPEKSARPKRRIGW